MRIPTSTALVFLVGAAFSVVACGQRPDTLLDVKIFEGERFAHLIRLPTGFQRSTEEVSLRFDHYNFRVAASAPDLLLIKGCGYTFRSSRPFKEEHCSPNAFAVDTLRSFTAQQTSQSAWDHASLIEGVVEMDGSRDVPGEMDKPELFRPLPLGREDELEGYKFRGKTYLRRAEWMTALNFGSSGDGKLSVLAGYSKSHFSARGPFALDIFNADSGRRIAALDAAALTPVEGCLRRISIVNSRWVAVGLDLGLQQMYLFDFTPLPGEQLK